MLSKAAHARELFYHFTRDTHTKNAVIPPSFSTQSNHGLPIGRASASTRLANYNQVFCGRSLYGSTDAYRRHPAPLVSSALEISITPASRDSWRDTCGNVLNIVTGPRGIGSSRKRNTAKFIWRESVHALFPTPSW